MKTSITTKYLLLVCTILTVFSCSEKKIPSPTLNQLVPNRGAKGSLFVGVGRNLEFYQKVFFDEVEVDVQPLVTGNGDSIFLRVPQNISLGIHKVKIIYDGGQSNGLDFEIFEAPTIVSIAPDMFASGDEITITGTMLDLEGISICFNEITTTTFISQSATSIQLVVPEGVNSGSIILKSDNGNSIPFENFGVLKAPEISEILPATGFVGDEITIKGLNFREDETTIIFANDVPATDVTFVSSTEVKTIVPEGAVTGDVKLSTPVGEATFTFTVEIPPNLEPIITEVTPGNGVGANCELTIFGANFFGPVTVTFPGDYQATILAENETQLTVLVPIGTSSGIVTLTTPEGEATKLVPVIDVTIPSIERTLPKGNNQGGPVILYGNDLNLTDQVIFGNIAQETYEILPTDNGIMSLHVPISDEISGQSVPLRIKTANNCYSNIKNFQIGTEISEDAPVNTSTVNVVIPTVPGGTVITGFANDWTAIRKFRSDNPEADNIFITPDLCGSDTCDLYSDEENQNPTTLIGRYATDGSWLEIEYDGVQYEGAFDFTYMDFSYYEATLVARIVLTPVEFGDQVELLSQGMIDPNLSSYDMENNIITIKGRFFSSDFSFYSGEGYEVVLYDYYYLEPIAGTTTFINSTTLTFEPNEPLEGNEYYDADFGVSLNRSGCLHYSCALTNGFYFSF